MVKLAGEQQALREQVDRQAQEFNALYTVGKQISGLFYTDEILALVVSAAVNLSGAERGSLMLIEPETGQLYLRAQYSLPTQTTQKLRIKIDDTLPGRVIQSGRPVMLSGADLQKVQTSWQANSILGVPLSVGDKVIGVLTVDNQLSPRAFGKHDVHLLTTLADQAAIAIENARLFRAAERERAKLGTILREMQDVVIVTDDELRIVLINEAAYAAFQLTEADLGQPLAQVVAVQPLIDLFEQRNSEDFVWRADITLLRWARAAGPVVAAGGRGVRRGTARHYPAERARSDQERICLDRLARPAYAADRHSRLCQFAAARGAAYGDAAGFCDAR